MMANDIYIWASYGAGALVLIGLAVLSWRAKTKDEATLRHLEQQIKDLTEKQV